MATGGRGFGRAVPPDDLPAVGAPDGLFDEPGLADASRPADQQDAAGRQAALSGQVGGQGVEFPAPADEYDTRRDGGHAI